MNLRLFLLLACVLCGCGYSAGYKARSGIKSVAIPIFENRSLRRELEFPLTEAVVREVQRRTPLIVTSAERADVVLRGEIERFDQAVLVEGARDEVLESSAIVAVGVTAVERRTGRVLFRYSGPARQPGAAAAAASDVTGPAIVETGFFAEPPSLSPATSSAGARDAAFRSATDDAFAELAQRIVMLLEEPVRPR